MKKSLFFILVVIAVAAATYFIYSHYFNRKEYTALDLIPTSALIVYEKDDCIDCISELSTSAPIKLIHNILFEHSSFDSLTADLKRSLLKKKGVVVSLHAVKKDDFDLLYFIEDDANALSESIVKKFQNDKFRHSSRSFNSITIWEITASGKTFSFTNIDGIWAGSFTPFLVEEVIRIKSVKKESFKRIIQSLGSLPRIEGDAGNVYINLNRISEIFSIFTKERSPLANAFGAAVSLDVKKEAENLFLNGFSSSSVQNNRHVLSIFHNQDPVSFSLKQAVPMRTMSLSNFGISNGAKFQVDLNNFPPRKRIADSLRIIQQQAQVDLDQMYRSINNEIAICFFEGKRNDPVNKILVIETDKPAFWDQQLTKITDKWSNDTIWHESFAGNEIKEIPLFKFPEKLLWPLVTGFEQSFYTVLGGKVLIANNLDELKNFLIDLEEDEIWGRSVSQSAFLETTLLESNVSFYVNSERVFSHMYDALQPKWQPAFKRNERLFKSIRSSAFQFSHLNNAFYTNISINSPPQSDVNDLRSKDRIVTNLNSPLLDLYSVRSHVTRTDEILVQDSLNDLSLISDNGDVLWKLSLGSRITSDVIQIDFFANGKLQYFFATRDALHVVDRLGNYVQPYPVNLPGKNLVYANVIDYDHSKKYRFIVADDSSKLNMLDKSGILLDGWDSKNIGGALVAPPTHYRIHGRDYIIAVRSDGVISLMNRRGELLKNFPLKLNSKINGGFWLERGKGFSDTRFVVVTEEGYKVKFSVDGKVQAKEPLLKTSVNTRFSLVAEKSGKSYIVTQRDSRSFNLLDDTGKLIVKNESIGSHACDVSFYDFGSGKMYYLISDHEEKLTYAYDQSGVLLTSAPIPSTHMEIRPSGNEIKLFFLDENAVILQTI